jgi:hypothetical protein
MAAALRHDAPLMRLGMHPSDALHPHTVAHFQRLAGKLLATRQAMTKAAYATAWRSCVGISKSHIDGDSLAPL